MSTLPHPWLWLCAAAWYGGLSVAAFGLFVRDKRAAARGAWRVRERTLLGLVWLGGFAGGWAAMRVARHKTRRWVFRVSPWAAGAAHLTGWAVLLTLAGRG